MKFTLSWLKEHLQTEAPVAEIAEALTDLGLEVEEVVDPGRALSGFTLGRVLAAEKHPDADRLRVCRVATGQGERQIVCGAPNARDGIVVVVAAPGTYIPGIDTTIQTGRIRGVESHGMLCSARELQVGEDHDGIIELPSGEVGQSFADWLAENDPARVDPVIEIAVTPNRPDALGVRGIARDLAARGVGTLGPARQGDVDGTFACPVGVTIAEDTQDGCPVFAGRLIRDVTNGPSPDWLQARLKAVGLRPISVLVDITNFFTLDAARPLHVFDADRLRGDLVVRRAEGGETLAALDDHVYTLQPGMMAICDAAGVQSIAGIVGGEPTGCTEATTSVFLESAYWDPVTIARTGRRLGVLSDARHRFERGIDPEGTLPGMEEATRMILDLAGGEASEVVVAGAVPRTDRAFRHDPQRVRSLVGMDIPEEEQRRALADLGFELDGEMARVPSWRPDIGGEADLVEEIARVASLSKLQGRPMPRGRAGVPAAILTPQQRREGRLRRVLAGRGYDECVTYSFIDAEAAARFDGADEARRLDNPISSEMSHLRASLLPGLLLAASRNQARGFSDLALFELGPVFGGGEPGQQQMQATALLVGQSGPRDPFGARRALDVFDAKADLLAALEAVGAPASMSTVRGAAEWFHPGRSGRLTLGPKITLGEFGELHPRILAAMDVRGSAVALTLFLDQVPARRSIGTARPALRLSDLPAVERDFAFVLDRHVPADAVVAAASGADKGLIDSVAVFDAFEGAGAAGQLGPGKKSLAIAVRLQPRERTLTEAEIEAVAARIVASVAEATGGTLRA